MEIILKQSAYSFINKRIEVKKNNGSIVFDLESGRKLKNISGWSCGKIELHKKGFMQNEYKLIFKYNSQTNTSVAEIITAGIDKIKGRTITSEMDLFLKKELIKVLKDNNINFQVA